MPSKRAQPSTLATAMLLAFYEYSCADHSKWRNHLLGAKHLLNQVDFAGISKYIKKSRQMQREEEHARYYRAQQQNRDHGFLEHRERFHSYVDYDDEHLVGMLVGKKLRYDKHGQVLEDIEQDDNWSKVYTEKDLEDYETQQDLFWWYAKQDVYQSILGGGKLFLNYSLWSRCPPRSPLGRLNAIHGTYDHLMLLMGRVADFASRDLKRKRMAAKTNGGWRPTSSMHPPSAEGQMPGAQGYFQTLQGAPQMPQMPAFSGMLPVSSEAKLPMGFEGHDGASPKSTSSDDYDLESQSLEAEEEWEEIRNMFSVLGDQFGDDFQELGPEFAAPIQTPFGPALQYRTSGIAGIWMNYYMGLIACHRAHPAMPPAAIMAASIAARQTASMANTVGRIAAGLVPDCSTLSQINPAVGASLIESTTCLSFSGVQYYDSAQRAWTVNRLLDISRLTGWQAANTIATTCEAAWAKAAEAGYGPPYTRVNEGRVLPENIWAYERKVDIATKDKIENNQMVVRNTDQVHYALGLLGLTDDFDKLGSADEGNLDSPGKSESWMRSSTSSKLSADYDAKPNQALKQPSDDESVLQISATEDFLHFQAHRSYEIEDIILDYLMGTGSDRLLFRKRNSPLDSTGASTCERNHSLVPTYHKVIFHINWKIKEFMEEQYGSGNRVNVGSVVALTGSALHAQAQTIGVYLEQNWPDTGPEVLDLLQKTLDVKPADSTGREVTMKLKTSTSISMAFSEDDSLKVSAHGHVASLVELAQQLAWLGAVLHISTNGKIMRSRARITPSLAIHSSDEKYFTFDFSIDQLPEKENTCWHEMFLNPVIAFGFPIPDRGDEVGLEIPIRLMVALGGASHAIEYEGGLVIKGFSSMFVPLKGNRDSIQWHFIHNKDDSRLPYWEVDKRCPGRALLDTVDHDSLATARAFLGWWGTTTTHLGTANANYENIEWSDTKEPDRSARFSGGSIGFQNFVTGELNFSVGPKDSKLHISRTGPYSRIIKHASSTSVVLYDTAEKRAWMVPSSAVIAHMAQKRHQRQPFMIRGKVVDIKASDPTLNVYKAAEKMLSDNSNVILDNDTDGNPALYFRDLVLIIWTLLESLIDKDIRKETTKDVAMHATTRESLRGWEFMDIVDERSPLRLKETYIKKTCGNWVDFATDINAIVLFASGLEDIIKPAEKSQKGLCHMWKKVPKDKDYLAASVAILKRLFEQAGSRLTQKYLTSTHIQWHRGPKLFENCTNVAAFRCTCDRIQQIFPATSKTFGEIEPPGPLEEEGAVIFGQAVHPFVPNPSSNTRCKPHGLYSQQNTPIVLRVELPKLSDSSSNSDDRSPQFEGVDSRTTMPASEEGTLPDPGDMKESVRNHEEKRFLKRERGEREFGLEKRQRSCQQQRAEIGFDIEPRVLQASDRTKLTTMVEVTACIPGDGYRRSRHVLEPEHAFKPQRKERRND